VDASAPIGIFDSGIGGLTFANALQQLLPQESFIYFGDTAHLPYGEKSTAAIQAYTIKTIDVLLKYHCKAVVIACYSASTAAYELAKEYTASRAKVISMIEPVVEYLGTHYAHKNVGLIGTKQTVSKGILANKVHQLQRGIVMKSLATPLLVTMIEEGFFNNSISHSIIEQYLQQPILEEIDALVLGCTHFPLIKQEIDLFYQQHNRLVTTIDASMIVAEYLKDYLVQHHLLNQSTEKPLRKFLVSDYTQSFEASTTIFFGEQVQLEQYKLWE